MQPEDRSASQTPARTPPQDGKFEDFDDPYYYSHVQKELENPDARNFVVEFGPEHCRIASNLTLLHFEKLLSQKRDPAHPIRWMFVLPSILHPEPQKQRSLLPQKYMEPVSPG